MPVQLESWLCHICDTKQSMAIYHSVPLCAAVMIIRMPQVVRTPGYQQWLAGFGKITKHLMLNSEAVPASYPLPSPATLQVSPQQAGLKPHALNHTLLSVRAMLFLLSLHQSIV